jgi:hypothetical protein
MKQPQLTIKPVDSSNWKDFEKLFESKGAPRYCWCMAWRMNSDELKNNTSANRKTFIKKRVVAKVPIGLLAYHGSEPVAWCSIAPRETYERLGGDETVNDVWSIACFFIKKDFRHNGLVDFLIGHAKQFSKTNGAKYVEAYPVSKDSPSYRFMGFISSFEKAGFRFVKKAGSRRNVMICEV